MEKYIIENKNGDDYITSIEPKFTLKVIPPEKQEEENEYEPYTVVAAVFADFGQAAVPAWILDPEAEFPEDWSWGENDGYDFEGMDISFNDDDVASCNKHIWLAAINYYCQLKLDKEVVTLSPYNYNYELSERNCDPDTLARL